MNRLYSRLGLLTTFLLYCTQNLFSQVGGDAPSNAIGVPDKFFIEVNKKSGNINDRLAGTTEKYLKKIARAERKLKGRLSKKDLTAAKQIFADAEEQYERWKKKPGGADKLSTKYIPQLDSLQTALQFLEKQCDLLGNVQHSKARLQEALGKLDALQNGFSRADELSRFLKDRQVFLREQLSKFGMAKELVRYNKAAYYYKAQVEQYTSIFEEPSKLQAQAFELLSQTTLFKEFFRKHSQLAGLFSLPDNTPLNATASFAGLQTQSTVQQLLVQRFGSPVDVQQLISGQTPAGPSPYTQLKDKVNRLGRNTSEVEMFDFKPNNQKTKQLKDRLEFGTNLQTAKANRFFPSTSDIGLSLGYKLNDKSVVGIGGSFKLGWGKDIRHIAITHEGLGLRTFIDYRIKGGFWVTGGGEFNYRNRINNYEVLNDYSAWQRSALIGLNKKYRINNMFKGNAQVMYDFLWKEQVPRTQPIIFRLGYSLK